LIFKSFAAHISDECPAALQNSITNFIEREGLRNENNSFKLIMSITKNTACTIFQMLIPMPTNLVSI